MLYCMYPRPSLHSHPGTDHRLLFLRPPAGSARLQPIPRWLLQGADYRIEKERTGREHYARSLLIQYDTEIQQITEKSDFFELVNPNLPSYLTRMLAISRTSSKKPPHPSGSWSATSRQHSRPAGPHSCRAKQIMCLLLTAPSSRRDYLRRLKGPNNLLKSPIHL